MNAFQQECCQCVYTIFDVLVHTCSIALQIFVISHESNNFSPSFCPIPFPFVPPILFPPFSSRFFLPLSPPFFRRFGSASSPHLVARSTTTYSHLGQDYWLCPPSMWSMPLMPMLQSLLPCPLLFSSGYGNMHTLSGVRGWLGQ